MDEEEPCIDNPDFPSNEKNIVEWFFVILEYT